MAIRPGFYVNGSGKISRKEAEFVWAGGFAVSQKKKNVHSLHKALGKPSLEVSTKSDSALGVKLSAFSLTLGGYPLENIFQSSKVFEYGGPYLDLLEVSPKEAKRDERLKSSGRLIKFRYDGEDWDLVPRTMFYDYIYCLAVRESVPAEELKELSKYVYFTDIEFNPNKSINTQAEAVLIVKAYIETYGEIPKLTKECFSEFYKKFF